MANWNARIASDFEYATWENNIYKDKSSETESAEMNEPVTELTDEEILEKAINIFGVQRLEMLDDIYWTSFARAIIKASRGEK